MTLALISHSIAETKPENERETFLKVGDQMRTTNKQTNKQKTPKIVNTRQDYLYGVVVVIHINSLTDIPHIGFQAPFVSYQSILLLLPGNTFKDL